MTPTIHPGDTMFVSIAQGVPSWTITVSDETSGQSSTTLPPYSGPLTSAEWIQEAPSVGCCIAHLAHDSTIDFTEATANGLSAGLVPADSIEIVRQRQSDLGPVAARCGRERVRRGLRRRPPFSPLI